MYFENKQFVYENYILFKTKNHSKDSAFIHVSKLTIFFQVSLIFKTHFLLHFILEWHFNILWEFNVKMSVLFEFECKNGQAEKQNISEYKNVLIKLENKHRIQCFAGNLSLIHFITRKKTKFFNYSWASMWNDASKIQIVLHMSVFVDVES